MMGLFEATTCSVFCPHAAHGASSVHLSIDVFSLALPVRQINFLIQKKKKKKKKFG
jgi:hypothetical protein